MSSDQRGDARGDLPVLVVTGPPASGKSTVGVALARRLDAVLLDQDVATRPLTAVVADLLGTDDLDGAALAGATRDARYETLLALAEDNLAVGRPVVLVAPYTAERRDPVAWQRLADRMAAAGGRAMLVWLRLDRADLAARMRSRAAGRDRGKLADLDAFLARVDLAPPVIPHVAVDASLDVSTQTQHVMKEYAMSVGPWTGSPVVLPANQPADRFYLGGARIAGFRGIARAGDHVPEDWVGSTTTVAGFDALGLTVLDDGRALRAAIAADPVAWLGEEHVARYGADPALLVKLLDAGERLPVHVHPDDAFARSHLGCRNGKTESWIILSAEPGATVHLGFREDVAPDVLAGWVERQDRAAMLGALHAVEVRAGDTVYVPAGLAHAIGEGILLLELQQAADLSLLLEYEGFAVDGPRDGHLGIGFDAALACVRHEAVPPDQLAELCGRVDAERIFPPAADAFFRADRHAGGPAIWEPEFSIAVVLDGSGRLTTAAGAATELRRGTTVLVPWNAGPLRVDGPVELIRCRGPVH